MGMRLRNRLRTVRLFAGWADSVVWFCGPVPYEESGLSPELITDLRAWGNDHGRTGPHADLPLSPGVRKALRERAAPLARRVAAEIGPGYRVEVDTSSPWRRRIRSQVSAANPLAVQAFRRLRQREIDWRAQVRTALDDGGSLEWRSTAPQTADSTTADQTDDPR